MVDKETSFVNKADEFIQMFKKGEEFTKELLRENEKLEMPQRGVARIWTARIFGLQGILEARRFHARHLEVVLQQPVIERCVG